MFRDRNRNAIREMRQRISWWVDNAGDAILARRTRVAFPPGLNDRTRDVWEALLSIADEASGSWAGPNGRAWRAAVAVTEDVDKGSG